MPSIKDQHPSASLYEADIFAATAEIAPVIEEVIKLLPLLFYLLVFEPKKESIENAAIIIALSFIFFRGIGTGAMHVICGAIVGGGLAYCYDYSSIPMAI